MSTSNSSTGVKPRPTGMKVEELRKQRCDRCGQRAYVVTSHLTMTDRGPTEVNLAWCAHHFAEHEVAIFASGAGLVADIRKKLSAQP